MPRDGQDGQPQHVFAKFKGGSHVFWDYEEGGTGRGNKSFF